jgi:hypothetical protein
MFFDMEGNLLAIFALKFQPERVLDYHDLNSPVYGILIEDISGIMLGTLYFRRRT